MINEVRAHAHQFSILAILLSVSMVLLVIFSYSQILMHGVIGFLALSYIGWGIGHHWYKKDLTGYIVLEYLMVSAIAVVLLEAVMLVR